MVAVVGEISSIGAEDANSVRSVTELKRVRVFDDHGRLTGRELGIWELELDASSHREAIEVQRQVYALSWESRRPPLIMTVATCGSSPGSTIRSEPFKVALRKIRILS